MNSNLIRISTKDMPPGSEAWLKYRMNGIGASEIATIMGLNPYQSAHQLFYDKVEGAPEQEDNIAMFMGRELEEFAADKWQYFEDDQESVIKNKTAGNIIRKCRKLNAILINPDYPHLLTNLDRVINKGDSGKEGVLELKTIIGFSASKWIGGIPPQYIVQVQQQLLITGLDDGELFILKDGRYMDLFKFQRNEEIINNIIEVSTLFWNNVLEARELFRQGLPFEHLEPSAESDNQEAYKLFLTDRFKDEGIKAEGTDEIFEAGVGYMNCNEKIKVIESEQLTLSNKIKAHMQEANLIDFGGAGKITYKANTKGVRSLLVKCENEFHRKNA